MKQKKAKIVKELGLILGIILALFIVLILFIRSPWGQNKIVNYATNFISEKTNTKVSIDKLYLTFGGNLFIKGLYLEDTKCDTLIYSKYLEANLPLWSMIRGQSIGVDALEWKGFRANIHRKDSLNGYNFQFLVDAFASSDTSSISYENITPPLDIILGDFHFNDFNIVFEDAVMGIESNIVFDEMHLEMDEFNLDKMIFKVSDAELFNANINYIQTSVSNELNAESLKLPFFAIDNFDLQQVNVVYSDTKNGINVLLDIDKFHTEIPKLDFAKKIYNVNAIQLKNSLVNVSFTNQNKANNSSTIEVPESNNALVWPDLEVTIADINLDNNRIQYSVENSVANQDPINFKNWNISGFHFRSKLLSLQDKQLKMNLESFQFKEKTGINLKELSFDALITDAFLQVENIKFKVNRNEIIGELHANYAQLSDLLKQPEKTNFEVNIPHYQLDISDIFIFKPQLIKNNYIQKFGEKLVHGNLKIAGLLSTIKIANANIYWGDATKISLSGSIDNVINTEKLWFSIPEFTAETTKEDASPFLIEENLGITLPDEISLSGNSQGTLTDLSAKAKLNTSQGIINVNGRFKNEATIAFDGEINIINYEIGNLLNNNNISNFNATITSSLIGNNINNLDAKINADISSITYNNYAFKAFEVTGSLENGKGKISSNYKDKNLNMLLDASLLLDSIAPEIGLNLEVIGADLQALGIMERGVRTGLKLQANFKGNTSSYNLTGNLDDGVVIYNGKTYLIGDVYTNAHVRKDSTSFFIKNKLLHLQLESNTDPKTFGKALQEHVTSYFYQDTTQILDASTIPVNLNFKAEIIQAPILNEVFFVNLKEMDTINISLNFKEKSKKLEAKVSAPLINYAGNEIDSLAISLGSTEEEFEFNIGFNAIKTGPLELPKTVLKGEQVENKMLLEFTSYFEDDIYNTIQTEITGKRDSLRLHVLSDKFQINKENWKISKDNEMKLTKNKIDFHNFRFSYNGQSFEITDKLQDTGNDYLALRFKNFNLRTLFNYLNPEEELVTGDLNGNFILDNPLKNMGFLADLSVSNFKLLNVDLGKLKIEAVSQVENSYEYNLNLSDGAIDMKINGDYYAAEPTSNLNLNIDLNSLKMEAFEGFTQGKITNASGNISGKFTLNGALDNPVYQGSINFNEVDFKIKKLNAAFSLANENLWMDNKGFNVNNFTLRDENSNTLIINGKVGTENALNPSFDLNFVAENFQLLKAKKDDNNILFGTANFSAVANLTGDLLIPKLEINTNINKTTDITYILPSATVNMESREGIVMFVNRESPDAILTRTEEKLGTITGFEIKTFITSDKEAQFTIIIDEKKGDNFQISGKADLSFGLEPNGRMSLSGYYNAEKGHYEMNLYNLVNRRFDLARDSRVTWSGNPFDAELDVRAIYKLKTSASPLMATQTSGLDPSVKNLYRQALPFLVYLNIDGALMQPKITFKLDMPEEDRGAINGEVYSRVQEVNQQESELNRQVFSLLVLNQFYPEVGNDGSTGGVVNIARENINDALSDQLNNFSDKLMGDTGVELNFGLNSFTDYKGATEQQRTQLDIAAQKKLFNDRLIVKVGSEVDIEGSGSAGEEAPLIGNVSLEYLLSENGKYRIKAFQKNEFETVIDGQIIVNGIALIFTQEFNKFRELWDAMFRSEKEKQKQKETKAAKEEEN